MHAPYMPQCRLAGGKQDPDFRTKPQLALALIERAQAAGIAFKAIVADCFYGDNNALEGALRQRGLPYVLAHRGTVGRGWAPADAAHAFEDSAREQPARAWQRIERRFRDGHTERWWAVELTLLGYGPDKMVRAVCAMTDHRALPELSTWYWTTNLSARQAPLAEVVRLSGLRHWVEQGDKQMKDELGWADFMVRSDRAIRRHWALVCCAFAVCWWHEAGAVHLHEAATPQVRKKIQRPRTRCCWLRLLRKVRSWLTPSRWLMRCWRACSDAPPPPELAALLEFLMAGGGINLYLRL